MNEKRIKITSPAGIGTATILVFFTVLTLLSFGVLSVTTAKSNSIMTEKTLAAQEVYYSAFSKAQEKIAKTDLNLNKLYETGMYTVDNILKLQEDIFVDEEGVFCEFEEKIDENRKILVKMKIKEKAVCGESLYSIVSFRTTVNTDIETDDIIPVFKE